jgi:hypothetical protein
VDEGDAVNYHQARQRKDSGLWDWTTMRDKAIWASGPCREHSCIHKTREEAERHFYEDQLDRLKEISILHQQLRCEASECSAWTSKGLEARLLRAVLLCEAHRDREHFAAVRPFVPGVQIIASW